MYYFICEEADVIVDMAKDVESATSDVDVLVGLGDVSTGDDPKAVAIYDVAMESIRDRLGITNSHLATEATALEHVKTILGKIKDFISAMVKKIVAFFKSVISWLTGNKVKEENKVTVEEVKKAFDTKKDDKVWENIIKEAIGSGENRFDKVVDKGIQVNEKTLASMKATGVSFNKSSESLKKTAEIQQKMIKVNEDLIKDLESRKEDYEKGASILEDFIVECKKITQEAENNRMKIFICLS